MRVLRKRSRHATEWILTCAAPYGLPPHGLKSPKGSKASLWDKNPKPSIFSWAQGGNKLGRIEVAKIIVHFDDGDSSTMTIKHKDHIADWLQWLDNFRLTDEQRGWSGNTANPWGPGVLACAISEVVWKNPNPELTISHIDLVSEVTDVAPFVVAITLE